ncbi:hypothetical protein FA13DRAFT_1390899 [Coprinellus micaceus]|uniref:Uncharacterized protein n=1 Tax=Coprinellus micaceus TaxID=71717 RepID=A0A4Y7SQV6_COPMI|nr:hypothetical protein FA13DRAFT_1390899 [Coprinellus micaceus]
MFMDSFGDWDELDLDSPDIHNLFPHVVQMAFTGLDPDDKREIFVREVVVPVSTSPEGIPQYWKATAVVLAQNYRQWDLDVSRTGELVRNIQARLGVETRPGWYELTGEGGPSLTPKQLKRLVKGSGSRQLCEMFEFYGWL